MAQPEDDLYDVSDTSESDSGDPLFGDDYADLTDAINLETIEAQLKQTQTGPQPPGARWFRGNLWAKNIPEWTDPTRVPYSIRHPAIRPSDTRPIGDPRTVRVPSQYARYVIAAA